MRARRDLRYCRCHQPNACAHIWSETLTRVRAEGISTSARLRLSGLGARVEAEVIAFGEVCGTSSSLVEAKSLNLAPHDREKLPGMSEKSVESCTAKRLEDLIADTQALDRRIRNLEKAGCAVAEQARTDPVPVEENPLPLLAGAATAPSTAPTLAAPRAVSYRVYLREYMKRERQRRALGGNGDAGRGA